MQTEVIELQKILKLWKSGDTEATVEMKQIYENLNSKLSQFEIQREWEKIYLEIPNINEFVLALYDPSNLQRFADLAEDMLSLKKGEGI